MKQPTRTPTRKMQAAGVAGAIAVIVAWVFQVEVPPGVESAIAVLITWLTAYLREERGDD